MTWEQEFRVYELVCGSFWRGLALLNKIICLHQAEAESGEEAISYEERDRSSGGPWYRPTPAWLYVVSSPPEAGLTLHMKCHSREQQRIPTKMVRGRWHSSQSVKESISTKQRIAPEGIVRW